MTDALRGGTGPDTWSINGGANAASFVISGPAGSQTLKLVGQPISMLAGATLTVHVSAPTTAADCGQTYNNTASVTTSNAGSDTLSWLESVLFASIPIVKTADAASVSAGSPIGFTVTISN